MNLTVIRFSRTPSFVGLPPPAPYTSRAMNSNPLVVGTYKRCNASTRKLVQWLVRTAEKVSGPRNASFPRLAIGNKQAARQQIPVDCLAPLARAVVDANPRVDIELSVLDIARDCALGCKEYVLWYKSLAKGTNGDVWPIEANRKHRYMVSKLEEISEMLRREVKARQPKRKKRIELPSDSGDFSNIYQHLEVEETTSVKDDLPTANQTSRKSKKPPAPQASR
ncbi:hypothetical protein DOTSEDRAFT_79739 [Dothistroma septosporum NZE10]|uniref:DUF6604 domain-containing protein n=1 Tax=Dothistroma septosporum (strain NZE10 / CBS 128990) TaxID=675120 RepID=N1PJR5_DOTSN|nr:hypothetical protein DOTSEDRAFT_79739 [Dothistroma septosporum NZE10]